MNEEKVEQKEEEINNNNQERKLKKSLRERIELSEKQKIQLDETIKECEEILEKLE